MDDPVIDVPETQIDDHIVDEVTAVIDAPGDADVSIDISPPSDSEVIEETETPLPSESEDDGLASDATEEPVIVASDVTPNTTASTEVKQDVTPRERTPDTRPKRRLGWRAYILGGSGGTK